MNIIPEYRLELFKQTALQKFGDQVDAFDTLRAEWNQNQAGPSPVLVFYGLDNQTMHDTGRKQQTLIASSDNHITIVLELAHPNGWDSGQEMLRLHEALSKYDITCPTFDIVYAIYWVKNNPGLLLDIKSPAFYNNGCSFLSCLAIGLDNNGEINWDRIIEYTLANLPTNRDKEHLGSLYSLPGMSAEEVVNWLPAFLADDIKAYLISENRNISIIIKGYEKLLMGDTYSACSIKRDLWLRELIAHLPEVRWIILSSTRIPWDEYYPKWKNRLKQYLSGRLSEYDACTYLVSKGIYKQKDQEEILASYMGIPLYLDLAVRCRFRPGNQTMDLTSDAAAQYLSSLNQTEFTVLQIISCSPLWEKDLLEYTLKNFTSSCHLIYIDKLHEFPGIMSGNLPGTIFMHQLLMQRLQDDCPRAFKEKISLFLFKHYSSYLPSTDQITTLNDNERLAVELCCYHGKRSLSSEDFSQWLMTYSSILFDLTKYDLLMY